MLYFVLSVLFLKKQKQIVNIQVKKMFMYLLCKKETDEKNNYDKW